MYSEAKRRIEADKNKLVLTPHETVDVAVQLSALEKAELQVSELNGKLALLKAKSDRVVALMPALEKAIVEVDGRFDAVLERVLVLLETKLQSEA